jgi:hypothetical protein
MFCQQSKPVASIANLLHQSSTDEVTGSMTAAATVLALAQIGGRQMIQTPPSFLLVNAGGMANDPIDAVTGKLIGLDRVQMEHTGESFERNRRSMLYEIEIRKKTEKHGKVAPQLALQQAASFRQYRNAAFGHGRVGSYTRRHDGQLGWITDSRGHAPLRLEDDIDRAAFRVDVRQRAERVVRPVGYGESIQLESKLLSVAGSVRADEWDDAFVTGIVGGAMPLVFLPHATSVPLKVADLEALEFMAIGLEQETETVRHRPVNVSEDIPADDWYRACLGRLRRRLAFFPPEYDFSVQLLIRQLCEWCHRLTHMAAMDGSAKKDRGALWMDLHAMSFHGICLGVESLGWHCHGFDAGCGRGEMVKLLTVVRDEASITRRDLLRRLQSLDATKRDSMLEHLKEEGLVTLTDRMVAAIPLADYLRALPAKPGLAAPVPLSDKQLAESASGSCAAEAYAKICNAAMNFRESLTQHQP